MRLPQCLLAAGCVLVSAAVFAQTDILQVIPEKSLAALVTKNADVAELHFRDLAGKLTGDLPEKSYVEDLLTLLKLRREGAEPPKDSAIDLKAPMAVVMVLPALDVKGMPLGVVVKTRDYKKLLEELGTVVGAAGAEVTPEGTDLLRGEKRSLFAASMGQFAVIADAEYVVRTFKAESEKNLAVSGLDAMKQAVVLDDAALYVNLDEVVKTYCEQINAYKQELLAQIKNGPADPNAPMPPEKVAKLLEAEIDFLVRGAQQVDALCYGFRLGPDGARVTTHVQAVPDTAFARIAGLIKPAPLDPLRMFDTPAIMALGWNLDPVVLKEMGDALQDFLAKSGLAEAKEGEEDFLKAHKKVMDAAGGPGAFMAAAPTEGKGVLRLVYVLGLKPNVDVREDLRAYLQHSLRMMNLFQGPVRMKSKLEAGVETYRDFPVDRLTVTFEANPDVPEPPRGPAPLKIVEAIYGPEVVAYITQVQDKLVYTVGYATSETLKAHVDKLLDGKAGTLTCSPGWQSVTRGLAPAPSGVFVVSYADLMRAYAAQIFEIMDADMAKAVREVKFDNPSGVGCTFAPAPKGVVLHLNLPMQEMENLRRLFMEIDARMKEKQQPPAPAPAPAPAPKEKPDAGEGNPPGK